MGEPIGRQFEDAAGFKMLWRLMRAVLKLGNTTGGGIVGNCGFFGVGGVERDTGKCFMKEVPNRTKPTLEREIPGTHILSDGWASYEDIPFLHGGFTLMIQ